MLRFASFRSLLLLCLVAHLASLSSRAAATSEPIEKALDVVYATHGGDELLADLFVPAGEGPFPAVVVIHGGGWIWGSKSHMHRTSFELAQRDFVAMSIDYRKAPQHQFPAQIEDCEAAVRWLRANAERYKVAPDRIAAYGYSAGGHLATLLGVRSPREDRCGVQAVVGGGAVCDFQWLPDDSQVLSYWLGGSRNDRPVVYRQAAPLEHIRPDNPPMYFFHGERDRLVPPSTARRMTTALRKAGVKAELSLEQGQGHLATFLDGEAHRAAIDFLDRVMKKPPKRKD